MSWIVKPARVSSKTRDMSLETFVRELEIWHNSNMDILVNTQYQDLVESLKMNQAVKGLSKYVGEHNLPVLNTQERQTVKKMIKCLEKSMEEQGWKNWNS